jgi:hypothetical protein
MMSWDLIAHTLLPTLEASCHEGTGKADGANGVDSTSSAASDYLFTGSVSNGLSCEDLIRSSESLLTSIATAENRPTP